MSHKIRMFALSQYLDAALRLAEYERDEDGGIIACVPNASGFFSQGDNFKEARENLCDAIEGNVLLALQLGFPTPAIEGITIEEQVLE
jgi:predicted RNase H-like HicB family nuclease